MTLSCYNLASSWFQWNELIMYPAAKTSLIALDSTSESDSKSNE